MADEIGPGSAVIAVDTLFIPPRTVAFILGCVPGPHFCARCGHVNADLLVLSLPHRIGDSGWCANHWKPYQGPEIERRLTSEPTPSEPEGVS